ncbi:calcium-binding protein [Streptomyces abikoensis]|uniref:calcium-binding protein n=1 Tax=Streptomyces abikoensis TaxID=97398 RepID=UPI0036B5528C
MPSRHVRHVHRAVGSLVAGLAFVAWAAPAPAAVAEAPADPPGCARSALPTGGVHIVCSQGVPAGTSLNGTDKADIIEVSGGDAHLNGAVNGLGGDDVITVDRIRASGGSFEIRGSIDGGDGDDRITVTDQDRFSVEGPIHGGAGDDTITTGGVSFRGLIDGGAGDDRITTGGVHSAVIDGGEGNDTLQLAAYVVPAYDKSSRLDGGPGNDTITVGSLSGPLHGGPGADEITVNGIGRLTGRLIRTVTVDGDEGADVIRLGAIGVDDGELPGLVRGGAGADLIEVPSVGQGRNATVSGGDDDDVIQGPGGTSVVVGQYGTVDGGRGDNLCRTDNRAGGTVTNCGAV